MKVIVLRTSPGWRVQFAEIEDAVTACTIWHAICLCQRANVPIHQYLQLLHTISCHAWEYLSFQTGWSVVSRLDRHLIHRLHQKD